MKNHDCVLYDRKCIDCGECEFCDLDPTKICDNCGKCLNIQDYASFQIDSIDGTTLTGNKNKQFRVNTNDFTSKRKLK